MFPPNAADRHSTNNKHAGFGTLRAGSIKTLAQISAHNTHQPYNTALAKFKTFMFHYDLAQTNYLTCFISSVVTIIS